MTSHNGREDAPREGVVLPSSGDPWGAPRRPEEPAPAPAPPAGVPWGQHWGPDRPGVRAEPLEGYRASGQPQPQQSQPPQGRRPAPRHRRPEGPGQAAPAGPPRPAGAPPAPPHGPPPAPGAPPRAELPRQGVPPMPAVPPPVPPAFHQEATQLFQPVGQVSSPGGRGFSPEEATQLIPPVREVSSPGGRGFSPEDATQLIPPVTGSPPQPFPHHGHGAWPQRDADATEVIPPVVDGPPGPYGTRETSLEATAAMPVVPGFDNLYDRQPAPVAGPPGQGRPSGGRAAARRAAAQRQRRRPSPVVIGVLVVTACAVVGLAAGAALSGGDGAAAEETEEGTTEEIEGRSLDGAGPGNGETGAGTDEDDGEAAVREQAEQLSELLADSSGSRETVIRAVGDVQECRNLDQAIEDLREAAGQREGLVTRLNALDVGALPGHAELAEALTEAWEASAEADEHFAVWGEEARDRKKVCRRGTARATDSTGRAYLASGEATAAKERAAALWNPVAREHGLPERQPVEL